MSKVNHQQVRKIWQPYNRKSQVLATIFVLGLITLQGYLWQNQVAQPQLTNSVRVLPEKAHQ
jgi:hypothetical protein